MVDGNGLDGIDVALEAGDDLVAHDVDDLERGVGSGDQNFVHAATTEGDGGASRPEADHARVRVGRQVEYEDGTLRAGKGGCRGVIIVANADVLCESKSELVCYVSVC